MENTSLLFIDLFVLSTVRVIRAKWMLWRKGFYNLLPWLIPASFVLVKLSYLHAWLSFRALCLSPVCPEKVFLTAGLQRMHARLAELELDVSRVQNQADFSVVLQAYVARVYSFASEYDELRDLL